MAKRPPSYSSTEKVIVIGASTGGVEALNEVILHMPAGQPRDPHYTAYAGAIHGKLRPAAGRHGVDPRLGSPRRGAGVAGPCLYRPRETSIFASAAPAQTMFAP